MDDSTHSPIETDEDGRQWLRDPETGKRLKDERGNPIPPTQTSRSSRSYGFLTYDSSQGHCPLCGKLTCRGECFR